MFVFSSAQQQVKISTWANVPFVSWWEISLATNYIMFLSVVRVRGSKFTRSPLHSIPTGNWGPIYIRKRKDSCGGKVHPQWKINPEWPWFTIKRIGRFAKNHTISVCGAATTEMWWYLCYKQAWQLSDFMFNYT